MRKQAFITLIVLLNSMFALAQSSKTEATDVFKLIWTSPKMVDENQSGTNKQLYFEGANFENQKSLPEFVTIVNKIQNHNIPTVTITDAIFQDVTPEEISIIKKSETPISENIEVGVKKVVEKKKELLKVSFIPLRKNPINGKI